MPGTTQNLLAGVSGQITGIADFYLSSPTFGYGSATYNLVATTQFDAGNFTGQTYVSFYSFLFPGNKNQMDFSKNDELYAANQYDFFRYPSATLGTGFSSYGGVSLAFIIPTTDFTKASQYSMPKPMWASGSPAIGNSGSAGVTGNIVLASAFIRSDGFVGPASFASYISPGSSFLLWSWPTINPANGLATAFTLSTFGIVGVRIWADYAADGLGYIPFFGTRTSIIPPLSDMFYGGTFVGGATLIITKGSSGPLLVWGNVNTSNRDFDGLFGQVDDPDDYQGTFLYGPQNDSGATAAVTVIQPQNPACLEVFNNFLFMGGFIAYPDTVWYSRVGEFEKRDPENFFEFGANDGDIVSCLVSYFTQLIIFKINSTFVLSGFGQETFSSSQVTDQYGCLSATGACVFQQRMWFLDKKGICEYNGANTNIVSNKLEPYFRRMNVNAARSVASMIHVKEQNQVQCSIPIDGATLCNLLVFYDYLADFWGTRTISNSSVLALTDQGANKPVAHFGDASGMIYAYGSSLPTDNGQAFTCVAQSRFITGDGLHTDEKMFRRLYIDADIPNGSTYNFLVNLYSDQGASPVYSATMTLGQFQNRMDFGVPATDLSVEIIYSEGNYLKLNGFTIEYRFQRQTSGQKV